MKETNIWLSPEELQHMLQGTLQWIDVASRTAPSRVGVRKRAGSNSEKQVLFQQATSQEVEQVKNYLPKEEMPSLKRLEGQPVIWLLGSVGLLTLSSWFYFVLFSK